MQEKGRKASCNRICDILLNRYNEIQLINKTVGKAIEQFGCVEILFIVKEEYSVFSEF